MVRGPVRQADGWSKAADGISGDVGCVGCGSCEGKRVPRMDLMDRSINRRRAGWLIGQMMVM